MTGRIYIVLFVNSLGIFAEIISFVELVTAVPDPDFEIRGSVIQRL